jgi:hypothetical protein
MTNVLAFPKAFGASKSGDRIQVSKVARKAANGGAVTAFSACSVDRNGIPQAPIWEGSKFSDAVTAAEKASKDWHLPIEVDIRRLRS